MTQFITIRIYAFLGTILLNFYMSKSIVAIVGRPNVGKSTLFNRIVGRQAAIVEDIPGVTRDRNYMHTTHEGKGFIVVDTGGFYAAPEDDIAAQMREQAMYAVEEADVIVHVLDGPDGLTPHDLELIKILRGSGKKVLWAINKIDSPKREQNMMADFYSIGSDDMLTISAAHGHNVGDLIERIVALVKDSDAAELELPKIAVIGRPNAGKSTFVNTLLGKDRMLVSPIAGTTRDAIDSIASYHKRKYVLIDTAGIRKKDTRGYSLERFAFVRSLRSIERSDVTVIVIDATTGIVSDDQKIAGMVHEQGKSALFMLSKWDMIEDHDAALKRFTEEFRRKIWFFDHAPVLTTSSIDKKRITNIFPIVDELIVERQKRISGAELNLMIKTFTLPPHKGRKVKLSYITQVGIEPPRFALFTNNPEGFDTSRMRAVEAKLRESFSFAGSPIRIYVRAKDKE